MLRSATLLTWTATTRLRTISFHPFCSEMRSNSLGGEDRPPRLPARPSIRQAATNVDNEDPPPMKPAVFPDKNLGHAFRNCFRDGDHGNLKLPFW